MILFQQQYAYSPKLNHAIKNSAGAFSRFSIGINTGIISPKGSNLGQELINVLRLFAQEQILIFRGLLNGYIVIPSFVIVFLMNALTPTDFHLKHRARRILKLASNQFISTYEASIVSSDDLDILTTYLRFADPDTLAGDNLKDKQNFIERLIKTQISFKQICRPIALLSDAYISVYYGYIQHATPAKAFLHGGKPVFCIGSPHCNCSLLSSVNDKNAAPVAFDPSTTKSGEKILQGRIQGEIDSLISYVPSSPYSHYDSIYPLNKADCKHPLICIYMHEFTDFHHDQSFPVPFSSYFHWFSYTYDFLAQNDLNFCIKLHPSLIFQAAKYASTWKMLLVVTNGDTSSFTDLSTPELIKEGLHLGITAEGSVASELAFLGVNCIALSSAPYSGCNMSHIVDNLVDYHHLILNYANLVFPSYFKDNACSYVGSMARQSLRFYSWEDPPAKPSQNQIKALQNAKLYI